MSPRLADLHLEIPLIAAPMAGGPGTPELVVAAARAGGLGFLAAGYRTAAALAEQISRVRESSIPFGVNVFAPNPVPVDLAAFHRYALAIRHEADQFDLDLADDIPIEDDDHWRDKIDVLLADPVPVVSFTFAVPDRGVVADLRRAGSIVVQTVTSADEALLALDAGVDALAVQASAAGGHWGTFTPDQPPAAVPLVELLAQVRRAVNLPLVAAGGLATPDDVAAVLDAGADAAMLGTVLLRTEESGASAAHQAALADPGRGDTVMTRAFTGRPARALRNRFVDRYDALAPAGYPAIHHLTSPLRKSATAAGDPELVNLWAGTGYRHASVEPAAELLTHLAEQL